MRAGRALKTPLKIALIVLGRVDDVWRLKSTRPFHFYLYATFSRSSTLFNRFVILNNSRYGAAKAK